jgi:hypothetical protein
MQEEDGAREFAVSLTRCISANRRSRKHAGAGNSVRAFGGPADSPLARTGSERLGTGCGHGVGVCHAASGPSGGVALWLPPQTKSPVLVHTAAVPVPGLSG